MSSLITRRIGRKVRLFILVSLIVIVTFLGYRYFIQAPPRTSITIGLTGLTTGSWPIYIAKDSGIFESYGLNATVVNLGAGRNVITALAAGQVQFGSVSTDSVVAAGLEGIDVVTIGTAEKERPFYLVTRSDITSIDQLRGKIGGVPTVGTGLSYLAIATMLRKLGLDPTGDVTLVGISGDPAVRLAALKAGKIDFALTTEPLQARKLGLNILFYVPDIVEGLPGNAYATARKYLEENKEIAKGFLKALTEAAKFFFENKEASKKILGEWLKEKDPEVLEQHYQDWIRVALKIPANNLEQVRNILEAMAPYTPKAAKADASVFIDDSIIQELESEGFFNTITG